MSNEETIDVNDKVIKLTLPQCIVGCSGAGGSHHEISGHHEITIDLNDGTIQIDRISGEDNYPH